MSFQFDGDGGTDFAGTAAVSAPVAAVGPSAVPEWATDAVLVELQKRPGIGKDELQAAVGMGPTDLRRALEVLEDDGVIRATDDGWEADPTATPTRREGESPDGVIGPRVWEPPAATGPVTAGIPWTSPEEPSPLEEEARDEVPHGAAPTDGAGSSEAAEAAFVAEYVARIRFDTPDSAVEVAREIGVRLGDLAGEVLGLEVEFVLDAVDETRRVFSR